MKFLATLFFIAFAGVTGSSLPARAYLGDALFLPPTDDYQRFETKHFKIVYPRSLASLAERASQVSERVHLRLAEAFRCEPSHQVTIILIDNEDSANGVTSVIGHQGIILYMNAPDPYSSIGEYEEWLTNLITHEYAHYVTLEQTRGIFEFTRYLFGDLLFPNSLWPTWLSEGMAVDAESRFTSHGRSHGTYYDTLTRDAVFRDTLGTDEFLAFNKFMGGPVPDFPFGEAPYYVGDGLIEQMKRALGDDAAARYAEESSRRIPFLINGSLENIGGSSFQSLWHDWILEEKKRLSPELSWLREHPETRAPEPLTPPKTDAQGARLSPDETKLAYIFRSGHERPGVHILDLASRKDHRIEDAVATVGLAWSSEGDKLYYSKSDFVGPYHFYSDLYVYDLNDERVERLTTGARAKDPDLCKGKFLVFTTQSSQRSELQALSLETKRITTLYAAPNDHRISNPRCSLDGKSVYFSEHDAHLFESINQVSIDENQGLLIATGKPHRLFGGADADFSALFPEPGEKGDIYFTRVKNGYYELAHWDPAKNAIAVIARSSGGYWLPSLGRKSFSKMAVTYLSSEGMRAALIDPHRPVVASSSIHEENQKPALPEPQDSKLDHAFSFHTQPRSYNLLTSLEPRLWSPYFAWGDQQAQIGASVLGWDDLDQFEYAMTLWYDSISRSAQGSLALSQRFASFRFAAAASSQVTAYTTWVGERPSFDEERKLSFRIERPFLSAFSSLTPAIVGEWARTWRDTPDLRHPFERELRLGAALAYSNLARYAYSIAPEKGSEIYLEGRRFFTGSSRAWKALASAEQVIPLFPLHAALDLKATGGLAPNPVEAIPESELRIGGHGTASDLDPPLRGYPLGNFEATRMGLLQAEYRLPIGQFFRGFGTFPFFLRNMGAFAFYDGAKLRFVNGGTSDLISGVGGGLLLNTTLGYQFPFQWRLEYAHGLNRPLNGEDVISLNFIF